MMQKVLTVLVINVACVWFWVDGFVRRSPESSSNYKYHEKHIQLKYGRLHYPDLENEEDGHLTYRWLADDIVKTEDDLENDLFEIEMTEKTIKIPGGCELTEAQYGELETFKKSKHYVKKCYCEHGGVYCQLRKKFVDENET